jgi:SAM-dependent methyltransferase
MPDRAQKTKRHCCAMKKLASDRWDVIKELIAGKEVLDLGCVDHEAKQEAGKDWLHRKIREGAKKSLGVDYAASEVDRLKGMGYDVVQGNVESLNLGRQFDVVIAGNIIEHLSNPGLFLETVKRHLKETGNFILTTDNCYGLRSLKAVAFHDGIRPNREHSMTFEEQVLRQLLERHQFSIKDFYYYNGPYDNPLKKWLIDALCRIRKSWAWQMLAVAKKRPS